jgi:hypothetical protein
VSDRHFFFDIETIPCQLPGARDEYIAAVTAPAQYKKPDSIAEWLKENREAEGEKAWLQTSFDGGAGHVCVIGWAIDDEEPRAYIADGVENERKLLQNFYSALTDVGPGRKLVGHNIIGFDLPFLWKRSMVLGVKPPWTLPRNPKPWGELVADTMLMWDQTQRAGGSMDRLCRLMGIPGKGDMDGSKVWPAVRDGRILEVADYCKGDVNRTRELFKRMTFSDSLAA